MKRIKVLLAKLGLDSHDRGLLVVASALRDAGVEVVLLGLHLTPAEIAQAAIQEDVDMVGLSSLADAHMSQAPRVVRELRRNGSRIPVVLGGIIPPDDTPVLKKRGIVAVFPSGSKLNDIVAATLSYGKAKATRHSRSHQLTK